MNKCYICQKKNTIQYICSICNKEYCDNHIYSHICNKNNYYNNNMNFLFNNFSLYDFIYSFILLIKKQFISIKSVICFFCFIIYICSFIFKGLIFKLCFYSTINYIIFEPWRIITYMFIHGSFFHLFFNLIALNLFGSFLEPKIGKSKFFISYLSCGIVSALIHFLFSGTPLIGASGSIFGLLSICSLINPNMTIFINFIPIKLKYSIVLVFLFDLFFGIFISDNIAHFAHIGGLIFGLIIGYIFILKEVKQNDQ